MPNIMGQLLMKFKKWRENLELSHEKAKHASSQYTLPEQRPLITGKDTDTPLTRNDSATEELFKKLETFERILENQRKFIEHHDIKIQEIENAVNKSVIDKEERENQTVKIGDWEETLQQKLKEYEGLLKQYSENYEKLKKEVEKQLQLHQKLQDNLLDGFLMGSVIMVLIFICLWMRSFYCTLLTF